MWKAFISARSFYRSTPNLCYTRLRSSRPIKCIPGVWSQYTRGVFIQTSRPSLAYFLPEVKRAKFGLSFRPKLAFGSHSFRNGVRHVKTKTDLLRNDFFFKFGAVSPHPLRFVGERDEKR